MERTYISTLNEKDLGKEVRICGWISTIREHGKVIFLDVRDFSGLIQTVLFGKHKDMDAAKSILKESCVEILGKVGLRPKGTENENIPTGKIELQITDLKILNACAPLPFELDSADVNEEVRLKYRFLDLRRKELQNNLVLRHKIIKSFRDYFDKEGFTEIETPLLGKSTPEGARDYVVPARNSAGKFYALPQSPQLYKQLLMVAGMEKYFQIAKCLRDEDLRADRQPEFTQLDVEMSFVDQEHIWNTVEQALKHIFKQVFNKDLKTPFPRISYEESMNKYKSDKPDLRKNKEDPEELAFAWIVDFPLFEWDAAEKKYNAAHHPFCMPNDMKLFETDPIKVKGKTYDLVLNGTELLSGSIRINVPAIQRKVFDLLGMSKEEQEEKFGFFLNAFSYGAPPHGGFAIGLDRLIQILSKAPSIREVIAFPKNKEARDVMLDAPANISEKQLKEIHIKIDSQKKEESKK
jgi:aspartyl-tRNA synthetase